ncbi:hypothetical protein [Algoriphagus namhaensis]
MEASLFSNILYFEAILIFLNVPALLLGLKFEGNHPSQRLWYEPAAILVPVVWFFLFVLLAVLNSKLLEAGSTDISAMIFTLAIVCAMYPYYTLGLEKATGISALKFGLAGNALILILALTVGNKVSEISPQLSYFIFPLLVWTAYTTLVLIGRFRLAKEKILF